MKPTRVDELQRLEKSIIARCYQGELHQILESGITPEMFTSMPTKKVFEAIIKNEKDGNACDMPTIGGILYSDQVALNVAMECEEYRHETTNIKYHIDVIKNYHKRMVYSKALYDIYQDAMNCDAINPYPIEEKINSIVNCNVDVSKTDWTTEDLVSRTISAIDDEKYDGKPLINLQDKALNKMIGGGFKPKQLITIAARTGCGKTTLATNIALHAAKIGHVPLYITIELDSTQIMERFICSEAKINTMDMTSHKLDKEQLESAAKALKDLSKLNIGINSKTNGSWEKAEMAIRFSCKHKGSTCVFVDYIQQFHLIGKKLTIREELNYITSRCKALAMELNVPIFIVAQLNRDIEKGTRCIPNLSDIKESSSIEQDSDIVIMLYSTASEEDKNNPRHKSDIYIKIAKNRSGMCGSTAMVQEFAFNRISSTDDINEWDSRTW